MFIRQVKKQRNKDTKIFYQYTLLQAARVDGKVKQRSILYLGSDPLLRIKENRDIVLKALESTIYKQKELFPVDVPQELKPLIEALIEKYNIKYEDQDIEAVQAPPSQQDSKMENVDLNGIKIKNSKSFGAENLCHQVLDKLDFEKCLLGNGFAPKRANLASVAVISRAIFASTEHKTAQILESDSSLMEFYKEKSPSYKVLYALADELFAKSEQIDKFLFDKVTDMFELKNNLVIFDISNTYFETRKAGSKLAKYGRSKEKRYDCPLVVFTGVVNAEGFIKHSRIYEGNVGDSATLEDMIADLEKHSNAKTKPSVVIDAGIATEENLNFIDKKGYKYVCVSRKRLKDYKLDETKSKIHVLTDRKKQKIELAVFKPDGFEDTWMYVQSDMKRKKEASMGEKLKKRFIEDLTTIKEALKKKRGTKKSDKVWERIGRAKQKHKRVSGRFKITATEKDGVITQLDWVEKTTEAQTDKEKGVYFIRTNYKNPQENELWEIYNTIREVEATFRCLKSELNIRPIHHQKDSRIESHIYLTILAYQLVNTIRYMLKTQGISMSWNNIVRIMNTQRLQTVQLPTKSKVISIRKPSRPNTEALKIYKATNCSSIKAVFQKDVVYH